MPHWNSPDTTPEVPGEYQASLDPSDTAPSIRRWWSGRGWSNPYSANWPAELIEKVRQQMSPFAVYWQPAIL